MCVPLPPTFVFGARNPRGWVGGNVAGLFFYIVCVFGGPAGERRGRRCPLSFSVQTREPAVMRRRLQFKGRRDKPTLVPASFEQWALSCPVLPRVPPPEDA